MQPWWAKESYFKHKKNHNYSKLLTGIFKIILHKSLIKWSISLFQARIQVIENVRRLLVHIDYFLLFLSQRVEWVWPVVWSNVDSGAGYRSRSWPRWHTPLCPVIDRILSSSALLMTGRERPRLLAFIGVIDSWAPVNGLFKHAPLIYQHHGVKVTAGRQIELFSTSDPRLLDPTR